MSAGERLLAAAMGDRVLNRAWGRAAWRRFLRSRFAGSRRVRLTEAVADQLRDRGAPADAAQLMTSVAGRVDSQRVRARMLLAGAQDSITAGVRPDGLTEALAANAQLVDVMWRAGTRKEAVAELLDGLNVAFHRSLHFDDTESPLSTDPSTFLAPLRASSVVRRMQTPRQREHPAHDDGLRRLLVATYGNWNFVERVADRYETMPNIEVRRLDVSAPSTPDMPLSANKLAYARLFGPPDARSTPWAADLAAQLEWCDTVWVEWGHRAAAVLSLLDPGRTRVVVRIHSYEAFTVFPHLIDWSRVDDVVFVADQLRTLVQQAVPATASGPRVHVLPNAIDLQRFAVPKDAAARHVIALVGWNVVAKDPIWAVDVLARLREHDPDYRLMLVGHPFDGTVSAAAGRYGARLAARLARPDVVGAVVRTGQTSDVATALRGVGTIVSSSVREASPQSIVEGASSGALPVVRNWPMLARYGGARAVFPSDWVVEDVESAAQRILAATHDEQTWRAAGAAAAEHVVRTFDWAAVAPRYDDLLRV